MFRNRYMKRIVAISLLILTSAILQGWAASAAPVVEATSKLAPDAGLIAVEQAVRVGKIHHAFQQLSELQSRYPEDLRIAGMEHELRVTLAAAFIGKVQSRPAALKTASPVDRVLIAILQQRMAGLIDSPESVVRSDSKSMLVELNEVLNRNPHIAEAVYLKAQLSILADDVENGRAAAAQLHDWDFPKITASQTSLLGLHQALQAKGWYPTATTTNSAPNASAAERIKKLLQQNQ